jgi:hypothetical protein
MTRASTIDAGKSSFFGEGLPDVKTQRTAPRRLNLASTQSPLLPVTGSSVRAVDMMGRSVPASAEAGTVRLTVGEAPAYVSCEAR